MESDHLPSQDNKSYRDWLLALKSRFKSVQLKSAVQINQELLGFYWELGQEIIEKQQHTDWGSGFLKQLSKDLTAEFPEIKGFSLRNLKYMRQWVSFFLLDPGNWATSCCPITITSESTGYEEDENGQQAVAQLPDAPALQPLVTLITSIPWGHNIAIITKCPTTEEALFYVRQTLTHGWSRAVLVHQIESELFTREGSATSNFATTLPPAQSDLAQQTLKDPYVFDFLTLTKDHNERDLENQLTDHISKFLLELGAGFAYLGRQVPLQVSERDFFLDLLFYHTQLHCYVVVELKTGDFEPEFAGKLNFYLTAVDETLRSKRDEPTIGILLCKTKDKLIAEYALSDINKPIGVSEYQLTQSLPDSLKPSLPSIAELEAELQQDFNDT